MPPINIILIAFGVIWSIALVCVIIFNPFRWTFLTRLAPQLPISRPKFGNPQLPDTMRFPYESGGWVDLANEMKLELNDKKGHSAKIVNMKRIRACKPELREYRHPFYNNGTVKNYTVDPGIIAGIEDVKGLPISILTQKFDSPVAKDSSLELTLSYELKDSFTLPNEALFISIKSPTSLAKLAVVFPKDRHPTRYVAENIVLEGTELFNVIRRPEIWHTDMPDGRKEIISEIHNPMLGSKFIIEWTW